MKVEFLGLNRQYRQLKNQLDCALQAVMARGAFILGPEVQRFEQSMASYLGVRDAIGLASGSDALLLSLMALGIKPGDEVITTTYSFFATASCITRLGAKPVFCDIDLRTFNLNPEEVKKKITGRTKALIPVHLYGNPCDMEGLSEIAGSHGLAIVEDSAQAIGAEYRGRKIGSFGVASCFSFYPTKNLGAYGDGGCVAVNDPELSERIRILRVHGAKKKYFHKFIGLNSRLDELQAAVLNVKLPQLDSWNQRRREIAIRYNKSFKGIFSIPESDPDVTHVYHMYVLLHHQRDTIRERLSELGVSTMIYYPQALHLQECFADLGWKSGDLPNSELACRENFALPIYPEMTDEEVDYVIESLLKIADELK
ncbi:MAG: DegT/DnrJ/EryC1/StrS family aminotransferase [Candidatus Wallbacteria bacterium]|nr:DegT/DnrJ/EryC1/StrS family aminotransferase [Candidatus Wallbacteria bacterium]